MRRPDARRFTIAIAFFAAGCGAGEPQNDELRMEALPAGWEVSTSSAEARQFLADGTREFDFNRIDEAYANFEQAIAADPDFAFAHLMAALTSDNTDGFVAHLGHATQHVGGANEFERLAIQAIEKSLQGDDNAAKSLLDQLAAKYASNPRAPYMASVVLYNTGNTGAFRKYLEDAIQADPEFVPAYMYLADSFTQSQPHDFDRAEQLLRRALELEPNESYIHDLLGDAIRQKGRLEEAAAAYTTAAELDPTSGGPLQQRGHVNTFLGRYAEARADYDAAIALAQGNFKVTFATYRAHAHLFEGNPRLAIDELDQLFAAVDGMDVPDPDGMKIAILDLKKSIAAHHQMLAEYEKTNQLLSGIRKARMARITNPDFRRAEERVELINTGFLALQRGRYDEARRIANQYIELRASETAAQKNQAAHALLGRIAFQEGDFAEAITHLEQDGPDNEYSWYLRARALESLGRTADAKVLYQRIATRYLNSPDVALTRNEALAKLAALN